MLNHNLVLKSDELFLAGDIEARQLGGTAAGLYARDTRHLSRFNVSIAGRQSLTTLSARALSATNAVVILTNRALSLANGRQVLPQTIAVEELIELAGGVSDKITVRNFSGQPVSFDFELELAADFRDLFAIRGFPEPPAGHLLSPEVTDRHVTLGYRSTDGLTTQTTIGFDQPCRIEQAEPASLDGHAGLKSAASPIVTAIFPVALDQGARWELNVEIGLRPAQGGPLADVIKTPESLGMARVRTDDAFFNEFVARSLSDLAMLQTSFPQGSLPAAGIPWYVAPFGRDSLIAALQTLHLAPEIAVGTLRVLAAFQGTQIDPWREEQPGKILHEVRQGELARLNRIPHTPYHGSVDATPLFALLFAETIAWTCDADLYHELLPHAKRAIEWIEQYGDMDGDGFVEYQNRMGDGIQIANQGWKDSFDSLNHTDGRPASGDIALVEVQGYVYAAYAQLAAVARHFGDIEWAEKLAGKAEAIRAAVEDRFWLDDAGFYAQALDGDKSLVAAISSNPGHLLYCGLPSSDRAAKIVERFVQPDLDSGWGIRTLGSDMATYNPMSYHNGSVWPHDNSLIIAGMRRYGHAPEANELIRSLLDAALTQPLTRLPELYCGYARSGDVVATAAPVEYPVSCSPQAWAAGTAPLLVRTLLGLDVDLDRERLLVNPALPPWLNELSLDHMHVLGQNASISVRRAGTDYVVKASGPVKHVQADEASPLSFRDAISSS